MAYLSLLEKPFSKHLERVEERRCTLKAQCGAELYFLEEHM